MFSRSHSLSVCQPKGWLQQNLKFFFFSCRSFILRFEQSRRYLSGAPLPMGTTWPCVIICYCSWNMEPVWHFVLWALTRKIVLQWTLGWMYLFTLEFSLDICSGVEFQDHKLTLFLVSKETSILCSIMATLIYIRVRGFLLLHSLSCV